MDVDSDLCSAAAAFRGTEEYAAAFDLEVWKAQQHARMRSELDEEKARLLQRISEEVRQKEDQRLTELDAFRRELEAIAGRLRLWEETLHRRMSQFEAREAAFEERRVKVAEQHEQHLMSLEGRTRRQLEESAVRQDALKAQLREREGIITNLEEKLRAAESEYDMLQRFMARNVADDEDRVRVSRLEEQVAGANTALMNLQLQLKERESELAVMRKERDELDRAAKLYKDQLNQLVKRYSELQEEWNHRERMLLEKERRGLEEAKLQQSFVALQSGSDARKIHRYDLLGYQVAKNIGSKEIRDTYLNYPDKEGVDAYGALIKNLQGEVVLGLRDFRQLKRTKKKKMTTETGAVTPRRKSVYAEVIHFIDKDTSSHKEDSGLVAGRGKGTAVKDIKHLTRDVAQDQACSDVGDSMLSSLTNHESEGRRESTEPRVSSLVDVLLSKEAGGADVDISSSYCYADVESWVTDGEERLATLGKKDKEKEEEGGILPPLAPSVDVQQELPPPLPKDFVQAMKAPQSPVLRESTRDEMISFVKKLQINKQRLLESGAYTEDDTIVKEMSDKIALLLAEAEDCTYGAAYWLLFCQYRCEDCTFRGDLSSFRRHSFRRFRLYTLMEFRIPLSLVLDLPSTRRHRIPHRTLILDAVHPFIQYLCSDDTRLPHHPDLTAVAQPAGEYETYVGEDIWVKEKDNSSDDSTSELCFDDVVQWVIQVLNELDAAADGVVLCGQRVVADDCGWAVISRTATLNSLRDVFVAMRSSSKFLHDVHYQLRTGEGAAGPVQVRITLAKALGGDSSKEFRVFLPYRLYTRGEEGRIEAWGGQMYTGVSQRATDVCFPTLMAWDVYTHEKNYDILLSYVQSLNLLEKAFEIDPQLRTALFRRANLLSSCSTQVVDEKFCVVLLAVDVLFESSSLPFYVLSSAVQCFRHDNEKDAVCTVPFIVENDTLPRKDNVCDGSDCDEWSNGEWDTLHDSACFFRLFRDVSNWNLHMEAWRQHSSKQLDTCDFQKGRRFFLIASERSDLVTTKELMAKRGLPLEFIRPELLLGEGGVIQEYRERLSQCLSTVGKF